MRIPRSRDNDVYQQIFSCHSLLGICVSVQYIQSSWCAVLLVIQLLRMNRFFPLYYGFFSCVSWSFERSMVLPADFLCISGFFLSVIHFWAFVHHFSMFIVLDVLFAVSYTAAKYE